MFEKIQEVFKNSFSGKTVRLLAFSFLLLSFVISSYAVVYQILYHICYLNLLSNLLRSIPAYGAYLFFPEKPLVMLSYLYALVVLGIGCLIFIRLCSAKADSSRRSFLNPYTLFYYLLLMILTVSGTKIAEYIAFFLWFLPFAWYFYSVKRAYFVFGCVILGSLIWFGYVFFWTKPLIMNTWYGYPQHYLNGYENKASAPGIREKTEKNSAYKIEDLEHLIWQQKVFSPALNRTVLRQANSEKFLRDWEKRCCEPISDDSLKDLHSWGKYAILYSLEDYWKQADRFVFHHHNFLLGTANEMKLGRPAEKINMQYGFGNTWTVQKILSFSNGFDYLHYFRLHYGSFFLYFAGACLIFFFLTRSWLWTGFLFLCQLMILHIAGWPFVMVAPGFTPGRHFYDMLTVLAFYLLFQDKKRGAHWAAGAFFCFSIALNVWQDVSWGLLISVAAMGAFVLALLRLKEKKRTMIVACVSTLLVTGCLYPVFRGKSALSEYYAQGLVGLQEFLPVSFGAICLVGGILLSILYFLPKLERSKALTLLFCNMYCFTVFLYYLWSSDLWHLLYWLTVFIFFVLYWFVTLKGYIFEKIRFDFAKILPAVHLLILCICAGCVWFQVCTYYRWIYLIDRCCVVRTWENPRIPLRMAAEEAPFQQAVSLIHKYTPNEQKGIAIVSRFDNILPFAAEKYSDLPYPDLQWFLVAPKENEQVVRYFKEQRPLYVFVDTAIDKDFEEDFPSFSFETGVKNEYIARVLRMKNLADLWHSIQKDYVMKEKTEMITVWERKKQ